ncbi:hypothetical protein AMJ57_00545 [Parcubacteria bacterium SG8_24]|nr:MAG: hypothetical protein AMJ57_00545 [Parcubacteria bacterium SG8_24]
MSFETVTKTPLLDQEIDTYTREYEQEKTQLDIRFREALKTVPIEDQVLRRRLWEVYRDRIKALQSRLYREIKRSSHTVLRKVVPVFIPRDDSE